MRASSNKTTLVVPKQAVTAITSRLSYTELNWTERNGTERNGTEPDRVQVQVSGMMKERRKRRRSTLTLSQPVLEVGVTPSFPVEIDAVTDEQSPAHPRGQRAGLTTHHDSR